MEKSENFIIFTEATARLPFMCRIGIPKVFITHTIISACKKSPVSDKKASFLRLAKLEKCEFTDVNDHFESERNEKNGVFWLTPVGSDRCIGYRKRTVCLRPLRPAKESDQLVAVGQPAILSVQPWLYPARASGWLRVNQHEWAGL
ncbi:hypothetical protein ACT3CD_09160 [Geofilum sp. OHC36d9]|uniref:hypothetical protein n=1 Tax=Geofilum sp. OHC36d9 TaxID=3458413 RepID=UPI0040341AC0